MEKRMVIAIALSLLVLVGFQVMFPPEQSTTPPSERKHVRSETDLSESTIKDRPITAVRQEFQTEETVNIHTENYELVFSDIGGSLKKILLEGFYEDGREEVLYLQKDPEKRIFAISSSALNGLEKVKYDFVQTPGRIEYSYTDPDWIRITKTYFFNRPDFSFDLEVKLKNLSSRRMDLSYNLVGPGAISRGSEVSGRNFVEANTLIDGKVWKVSRAKGIQERKGIIDWTAVKNRYFTMILKPQISASSIIVKETEDQAPMTELNISRVSLAPNEEATHKYLFYAGPLSEKTISGVSEEMKSVIDYGFFGGVSRVLLSIMRFFHTWTNNWGLSIIGLTVLINLLLFPLAIKSFTSMHQMKKIQPHIQKLKELHKDNPQKLNKETMELYKKYNVNPLGGCLPLLLQMPIFIALYQGLIRSVELKGASFLWIRDLSKPDAVPIPFSLPVIGNSINVLPLLMLLMMVLQQKITQGSSAAAVSPEQASQQKIMMIAMPLIFGLMFYRMPSGLVLYWLVNTILMTTGQGLISRKMAE